MRLYISGPMTGLPDFNYPAFRSAAAELTRIGYEVSDPSTLTLDPPELSQVTGQHRSNEWLEYMKLAIPMLLQCDAVAVLDGWTRSRGARLEVHIAGALGLKDYPLERWLTRRPQTR